MLGMQQKGTRAIRWCFFNYIVSFAVILQVWFHDKFFQRLHLLYLVKPSLLRIGLVLLGLYGWTLWVRVAGWKSSSMSRTFASRDFDFSSFLSSSFIFFCTWIVFLVIFSPGRDILSSQGIHCRKTSCTCKKPYLRYEKQISDIDTQSGISWVSTSLWW